MTGASPPDMHRYAASDLQVVHLVLDDLRGASRGCTDLGTGIDGALDLSQRRDVARVVTVGELAYRAEPHRLDGVSDRELSEDTAWRAGIPSRSAATYCCR